ncbi:MAG: gliding motility-associated C-terminal domain-containing protein, partial [Bacteroidota bacterium]
TNTDTFTVTLDNSFSLGTNTIQGELEPCSSGGTPISETYSINSILGATYTWSVTPAGATITGGQGTSSATIEFPSTGSFDVTVDVDGQCPPQATDVVTVTPGAAPGAVEISDLTATTPYCPQDVVDYEALEDSATADALPSGLDYTWTLTGSNTFASTGTQTATGTDLTNVSVNWDDPAGGTLTVSVDGGCITAGPLTDDQVVTLEPVPDNVTISPINASPCPGTDVTFTATATPANPNYDYAWTLDADANTAGSTTNQIDVNWPASAAAPSVDVEVSNPNCPAVTVSPASTPNITITDPPAEIDVDQADLEICLNGSGGTGTYEIAFTQPAGFVFDPTGDYVINWSVDPAIGTIVGPDDEISVTVDWLVPGQHTLDVEVDNLPGGGGCLSAPLTPVSGPIVVNVGPGAFSLTQDPANPVEANTPVDVNTTIDESFAGLAFPVTLEIDWDNGTVDNFTFNTLADLQAALDNGTFTQTFTQPSLPGNYEVSFTITQDPSADPCPVTEVIEITVVPPDVPQINFDASTPANSAALEEDPDNPGTFLLTACPDEEIPLEIGYEQFDGDIQIAFSLTDPTSGQEVILTPFITPPASATPTSLTRDLVVPNDLIAGQSYQVNIISPNTQDVQEEIGAFTLVIREAPNTPGINIDNNTFCANQGTGTISLSPDPDDSPGSDFQRVIWSVSTDGGVTFSDVTPADLYATQFFVSNPTEDATYRAEVYTCYDVEDFMAEAEVDITVLPNPQLSILLADNSLELPEEQENTFTPAASGGDINAVDNFIWTIVQDSGDGYQGLNTTLNSPAPLTETFNNAGQYSVTLVGETGSGANVCTSEARANFVVIEDPNVFVATAFTPNGDGMNDEWIISGQAIQTIEVYVYDRWGSALVAETMTRNAIADGQIVLWDGADAPEGVYVYTLKITLSNDSEVTRSGTITLLR